MTGNNTLEHTEIAIPVRGAALRGDLTLPPDSDGLVLVAHGSDSDRHSPRNQVVAQRLHAGGMGTLLFDLLTADEQDIDARTGELRFNIGLLTDRLNQAVDWVVAEPRTRDHDIGLFGASTGAAAALASSVDRGGVVRAVVSRGGRADLASEALPNVTVPTLFIVGGDDSDVLKLTREAAELMANEHVIEIVEGAGHLFDEPGKTDEVARLTRDWFARHVRRSA